MIKAREGKLSEHVKLTNIMVDERAQRSLDEKRAERLSESFDWTAFGNIHVSLRHDGSMYVVDGQHRVQAARMAGFNGSTMIPAVVHRGLSIEQEAHLFRVLNAGVAPKPIDKFLIGLTAGYEEECEINKIVESLGVHIRATTADNCTQAVTALRKVYRYSPDCLREAITVLLDAWGGSRDSLHGDLIVGVGSLLHQYGWRSAGSPRSVDKVDTEALVHKMASIKGGPLGLKGRGKLAAEVEGSTVPHGIASALVIEYNKGRRPENKLAAWRR